MSELFAVESKSGEISSDEEEALSECSDPEPEDEDLISPRPRASRGMPVVSKSFCDCLKRGREKFCRCGEENTSK